MESEIKNHEQNLKDIHMTKIVIYVIAFLFTLLMCYNSPGVSSLKFFYKVLVYVIFFVGGILGGQGATWLNENFPYPINWVAGKFNLQDSFWFKLIGAQVVGVIAGSLVFGGIIANILHFKL